MSLKHLATRLPSTAAWAVTHPVASTSRAVGFARGVVTGGIGLVEVLRKPVPDQRSAAPDRSERPASEAASEGDRAADSSADDRTPEYVAAPPTHQPPDEPPVDVVGEALAAEQEDDPALLGGIQGEPHPVTREEEHEGAPLTRAELDEIDDETDEALEGDEGDVLPDQGLLLDPGVAKAVRSETDVLREAADPDKG